MRYGRLLGVVFTLTLVLAYSAPVLGQTAQLYRQQAHAFAQSKSWDEAINAYRKALELEPNDALTHYDLALALEYKGYSSQAVEEFESAIRLKPKWSDAHYGLGAVQYDLHDYGAAVAELRKAVEVRSVER